METDNEKMDLCEAINTIYENLTIIVEPLAEAFQKIMDVIVEWTTKYPELTLAILANDDTEVNRLLGELEESMINQKFVEAEMEDKEDE